MTTAILGPAGTFCDVAAGLFKTTGEKRFYPTIDAAMRAVGNDCATGVVPIENTLDGYVQRTLDLLLELDLHIAGEAALPVHFAFVGNARALSEIKTVFVQFKANGQCKRFLDSLQAKTATTDSNMESFFSAENGGAGTGAIIPRHMLKNSSLPLKLEDVTDSDSNFTRFVRVAPGPCRRVLAAPGGRVRAPLYIVPKADRPGMLFEILGEFSKRGVNLVSIMSRPTKKHMGTYNFYIEVDGASEQCPDILAALEHIRSDYGVKLLGMYEEVL